MQMNEEQSNIVFPGCPSVSLLQLLKASAFFWGGGCCERGGWEWWDRINFQAGGINLEPLIQALGLMRLSCIEIVLSRDIGIKKLWY